MPSKSPVSRKETLPAYGLFVMNGILYVPFLHRCVSETALAEQADDGERFSGETGPNAVGHALKRTGKSRTVQDDFL